jgi:hypothetical protein
MLADKFSVTGVCDVSRQLLDAFGKVPGIKICSDDYMQIAESPDVDVVFVLNSHEYHTETTAAALKAGKDVFVEKPLGLSISDVEKLKLIQKESGKLVFVGYMRRFAPAFLALKNDLSNLGKPLYVKLRDIIGPNKYFVHQGHAVIYPDDIPEKTKQNGKRKEPLLSMRRLVMPVMSSRRRTRCFVGWGYTISLWLGSYSVCPAVSSLRRSGRRGGLSGPP